MSYSKEDVIQYIEEEDVKFIRLAFCDLFGKEKNISIMPNMLEEVFEKGLEIDASCLCGYEDYSKIVLHPDPSTISVLAWRPSQGRVVRMFSNITDVEGKTIATSPRDILQKVISKYPDIASSIKIKTEFEFYLFKLDEEGYETTIPYDDAGFMDVAPLDKGENIRREVCLYLSAMDIETSGSHHSCGPGQNRITLSNASPLVAAEHSITFEGVVKNVSSKNGLSANFEHYPMEGEPVSKNTITITADPSLIDEYYAALKKNLDEVYLFLNNTPYLYPDYDEDKNVAKSASEIKVARISSNANFYFVIAAIIGAIAAKTTSNKAKATSLEKAKKITSKSSIVKELFPNEVIAEYAK